MAELDDDERKGLEEGGFAFFLGYLLGTTYALSAGGATADEVEDAMIDNAMLMRVAEQLAAEDQ